MEKQRNYRTAKSCRRLLVSLFLILCYTNLFSQNLTAAIIKELTLVPATDRLYAKEDIKFEVFIPYVKSNQIAVQNPPVLNDVFFKQLKKYDDFARGGVNLEIWYNFGKKGEYQLPQLSLIIQNRKRNIKFSPVTISDNPADMSPRIVIQFEDGRTIYSDSPVEQITMPVGKPVSFTVNLQYAVQLIQFSYDIPKDSIFTQTNVFEIIEIKYREKKYSDELIPVSSFDWTGLAEGPHTMPPIKLQVTGYNGYRIDCVMPEFTVNFVSGEELEQNDVVTAFDDAFAFNFETEKEHSQKKITEQSCETLAELRIKERNSIFGHSMNKKERQAFEEEYEISGTEDEFYMGIFYISILVLVMNFVIIIYLAKRKSRNLVVIAATFLICTISFFIFAYVKKDESYAIFKGGKVSSIPESKAESYSEISAGYRVHITERAGKWFYVELGETGGWCQADKIIFIE